MTLSERIKECRRNSGLAQEKVAELVGVSRQAVTKWETGQSAPSTENLFKLAEIFETTVDMIVGTESRPVGERMAEENAAEKRAEGPNAGEWNAGEQNAGQQDTGEQNAGEQNIAEQMYTLYRAEQEQKKSARRSRYRRNLQTAILIAAGYFAVFVIGRLMTAKLDNLTVMGFFSGTGTKHEYYLFGWLLTSKLFGWAMAVSVIPALFGKYRFSLTTLIGFVIAIPVGEVLGPNPEGAFYGNSHYGWAIWGGIYLAAMALGIVAEVRKRQLTTTDI